MGHTGSFSVVVVVTERVFTWFSGDDFEHVVPLDDGAFTADVHDILKDIDDLMGPDPADDPPDEQDDPAIDDGQSLPILPPAVEPKEEVKPTSSALPVSLRILSQISLPSPRPISPHPPSPYLPSPHPPSPRLSQSSLMRLQPKKKKRGIGRAWKKLKGLFMNKFEGDEQPPKLSDRLAPERDDEVRWYDFLFPKPPKPTKTRR